MSEEHKVYVPLRGKHVEPQPIYAYSAQWYKEQGLEMPPEKRQSKLSRWIGRTFEFDREEGFLRIWRLSIWWEIEEGDK